MQSIAALKHMTEKSLETGSHRQREKLKQEADGGCGVAQRQHCQIRPLALVTPQHEKCAGNHHYRRIEQRYEEAGFQATVAFCLRKSIVARGKQMVKPLLRSPALCEVWLAASPATQSAKRFDRLTR